MIQELLGKTLKRIKKYDDEIEFITVDGERYRMYHNQSCCESVSIEDIAGDLDDLIGNPILDAREETSDKNLPPYLKDLDGQTALAAYKMLIASKVEQEKSDDESFTWTFYLLSTIKGSVTIRWYGTSSGYYSETVDFEKVRQ